MADRLTKAEEETKAEKAARVAIENQRIQDGARGALRGALADLVNPLYLDDAMTRLDVIEKRLKTDDKGNPILTVKRAPYKGAPEEDVELSLDEAIPLLVQSKDMARYLLPPGGQGGDGQRGGSHQQRKAPGNTGAMPSSPVVKPGMSDAEKNAAVLSALQASGADMSMFEG
jgi:hypothetical protein